MTDRIVRAAAAGAFALGLAAAGVGCGKSNTAEAPKEFAPVPEKGPVGAGKVDRKGGGGRGGAAPMPE